MKVFITALVIAALLGAITTELYDRFLDGKYLGLLALTFIACLTGALAVTQLSTSLPASRPRQPTRQHSKSKRHESRETGTVKWFNRSKGFGFIIRQNAEEIFVHYRSIKSDGTHRAHLSEGERVTFTVVERNKGQQAENVAPVGASGE
jgi:CspA family cold shock protein